MTTGTKDHKLMIPDNEYVSQFSEYKVEKLPEMNIGMDLSILNTLKTNFITENSNDIIDEDILYAYSNINRGKAVADIDKILLNIDKSIKLEMGIFEFALVNCMLTNMDKKIVPGVYKDKLEDLLLNLDPKSYLKNNTLCKTILSGNINPRLVAFMAPDQLHPESWAPILQKVAFRVKTESNVVTSDLYECEKCLKRRMRVSELQMRGSDEPTTLFLTCLECYNVVIV